MLMHPNLVFIFKYLGKRSQAYYMSDVLIIWFSDSKSTKKYCIFGEERKIKNQNYFYAASIFCDFWKAPHKLYVRATQGLGLEEKSITSCPIREILSHYQLNLVSFVKTGEGTPKNKPVGFIPLELPVPGNENKDKLDEMKDVKLKIKSLPSKSAGNDKKKNRRSSSEVGTGESANKLLKTADSTSTKKAKLKSPKEDLKQVKQEEKKVEKITFRRSSGDSWSSSTSSSSLLGNASGNKNTALNALLAEIGYDDDDDDDDEVDIFTPFQSSSTHTAKTQKQKSASVISPNNSSQSKDSKDSSKVKVKGSTQTKKSETSKNGRKNGLKSPTTKSPSVKQR